MTYKDQIIAQGKGTRVDTAEMIEDMKTGKKKQPKRQSNFSAIRGQLVQAQKNRETQI